MYFCTDVCLLYGLNLLLIFYTESPLDILLNSLAIEFIHQMDEAYVDAGWFDVDFRFLRAGSMALVLQHYLELHELRAHGLEDKAALKEDSKNLLRDLTVETLRHKHVYSQQGGLQDSTEVIVDAQALHRAESIINPREVRFLHANLWRAWVKTGMRCCHFAETPAIFERYKAFRSYEKWKNVLFAQPEGIEESKSKLDQLKEFTSMADFGKHFANGKQCKNESCNYITKDGKIRKSGWCWRSCQKKCEKCHQVYKDLKPYIMEYDELQTSPALKEVADKLLLRETRKHLLKKLKSSRGCFTFEFAFLLFDGILSWLGVLVQVLFPFCIVLCVFAMPMCFDADMAIN